MEWQVEVAYGLTNPGTKNVYKLIFNWYYLLS